jgi:hypothetical protein
MNDVQRIQDTYKSQIALFRVESNVYEAEIAKYQKAKAEYEIKRNGAVRGAEGMMQGVTDEFGWAWINKEDSKVFWPWLTRAWGAQLVLVGIYILGILLLIKRKDQK